MKKVKARRVGRATMKLDELIQRSETLTIAVMTIGESKRPDSDRDGGPRARSAGSGERLPSLRSLPVIGALSCPGLANLPTKPTIVGDRRTTAL
jgi:hypothetical protein